MVRRPAPEEVLGRRPVPREGRFVIKHFHPNWIGWEEKDYAHQARLTKLEKDLAIFGPMTIRRTGANAMEMEIQITSKDGQARKEILKLKRRPL